MSPYWQEQVSPWTRASQNISGRLMQLPALRAQAQQRAAMGEYYQAHATQEEAAAEEARARTGLINTQAGHITFGEKVLSDLSDSTRGMQGAAIALENARASGDKNAIAAAQKNYDDANSDFAGKSARLGNTKVSDLVPALGKLMAQRQILSGSTNQTETGDLMGNAAIANNPANLAAKAEAPRVLTANSSLVDPQTGKPIGFGNAMVRTGQEMFTPSNTTLSYNANPAASGPAAPPKPSPADLQRPTLARELIKGGSTVDPSISGTNSTVGLKLYDTILNRQPTAAAPPTNAPVSAGGAAPAGALAPANEMVRVMHPDGRTGFLPRANLTSALQMGYREIQ